MADNETSSGDNNKPSDGQGSDAQAGAQDAKPEPTAPPVVPVDHGSGDEISDSPNHQTDRDAEEENALEKVGRAEWIMIAFTAVTAVAAIGGMIINWKQWDTSRAQLNLTAEIASDSARDTQEALNVAQRAAVAAERQSIATERALGIAGQQASATSDLAHSSAEQSRHLGRSVDVAVENLRFQQSGQVELGVTEITNFGPDQIPLVGLSIKNNGHVPITVRSFYTYELSLDGAPVTLWKNYRKGQAFSIEIPVGATRFRPMPLKTVTAAAYAAILSGAATLRIAAVVEYSDQTKVLKTAYLCREWYGAAATSPQAGFCSTPKDR